MILIILIIIKTIKFITHNNIFNIKIKNIYNTNIYNFNINNNNKLTQSLSESAYNTRPKSFGPLLYERL